MNQRKWGVILSYVNIIINVVVGLVYTPFVLRALGQSEYGLYSLIGSVVGYLSILDLGLGNTIIRYIARNRAVGNHKRESELNGFFLLLYSVIGICTVLIGIMLYSHIEDFFGCTLSPREIERARIMMVLLIVNLAFTFPLSIFGSILQAYERFVFLRIINIFRILLNPCIVLPCLMIGYGSVMMVVVSTILNLSCLLVNVWYAFHELHIQFRYSRFEQSLFLEILGYSFFIFLNAIMDKVYWGTGQFILGVVSGTLEVAVYAIAMQFMMMYMQFSCAISSVLLPQVTVMVANGATPANLTNLMIKVGRFQCLIVGYIFSMFLIIGKSFIGLWAGNTYETAYFMIILLMGAMFIPLVQNTGIAILQAMNLNRYRMMVYSVAALADILISIPLAKVYGGMGCAVATALALFFSTGYIMNRYYQIKVGINISVFWRNIWNLLKGNLVLVTVLLLFNNILVDTYNWEIFILKLVVYSVLYVLVMWFLGLNSYEKEICHSVLMCTVRRFKWNISDS